MADTVFNAVFADAYSSALHHVVGILDFFHFHVILIFDLMAPLPSSVQRSAEGEENWKEDEAVGNAENDNAEPHLEEWHEYVRLARWKHDDRQKSWEGTVEHARTHRSESLSCLEHAFLVIAQSISAFILFWSLGHEVGVADVGAVVNCQTDGDYVIDNGYTVECNIPEVKEPHKEQIDQNNTEENEHGDCEVRRDDHEHYKNSGEGKAYIHDCLLFKYNVGLKDEIPLVEWVGVSDIGSVA